MAKRSSSSSRWLAEHFSDPYVKRAQQEGWRSRAVFKLEEIQRRDHLLKPGMTVVDLGAAPGGWSQYAAKVLGGKGHIVALDILAMDPVAGVDFIQADFGEETGLEALRQRLAGEKADLVLSDIAPNITGVEDVDLPRAMYMAELVLEFTREALRPGGNMLVKVFQGQGFPEYLRELKASFESVASRKPKSSRSRSREMYLLARNYRL